MFHYFHRREILDAIGLGIAQRLEQPGHDQDRHIMRLAIQHPSRLLGRQPGRQLPKESQEAVLVISALNLP